MKRTYIKPMFYVEAYTFNESVASNPDCGIDINTIKDPLTVDRTTVICKSADAGHVLGGQNGSKGAIVAMEGKDFDYSVTLFNDGDKEGGCEYDYDARRDIVRQTNQAFAPSFWGNSANPVQHAPAWNGLTFRS